MTGKDVLKLLLLAYGFKKISITTYRGDYGDIGYEIYANNEEGEEYNAINCEGLMFNIVGIIDWMQERGITPHSNPFPGHDYSIKALLTNDAK